MIPRTTLRSAAAALVATLAGCATPPVPPTQVVVMKPGALPDEAALPPPGTVWRLDERELIALSPHPYVAPPPQPIPMPPREPALPIVPYAMPYYGWGAPFYGPGFGFSFGYSHPRHRYRRWR